MRRCAIRGAAVVAAGAGDLARKSRRLRKDEGQPLTILGGGLVSPRLSERRRREADGGVGSRVIRRRRFAL